MAGDISKHLILELQNDFYVRAALQVHIVSCKLEYCQWKTRERVLSLLWSNWFQFVSSGNWTTQKYLNVYSSLLLE